MSFTTLNIVELSRNSSKSGLCNSKIKLGLSTKGEDRSYFSVTQIRMRGKLVAEEEKLRGQKQ